MITEHHIHIHNRALQCLREIKAETLLLEYNVEVNRKAPSRYLQRIIEIKREKIKSMVHRYEMICEQLLPGAAITENPILQRYEKAD